MLILSQSLDESTVSQIDADLRLHLRHGGQLTADAARIIDLAIQLADHQCLWVPVSGSPGTDCIVKFSYLDAHESEDTPVDRVLTALSWRERTILIQLRHAGLVSVRRVGRSLFYAAEYPAMNGLVAYLTENCCGGAESCAPACDPETIQPRKRKSA